MKTMNYYYLVLLIMAITLNLTIAMNISNFIQNNPDWEYMKTLIRPTTNNSDFVNMTSSDDLLLLNNIDNTGTSNNTNGTGIIPIYDVLQKLKFGSNWNTKHMYLFTRKYRKGKEYELLDPRNVTSIKSSHFESRQTYIIIHGFISDGLAEWVIKLKNKLLKRDDCNVISIDWPAGSSWWLPGYRYAALRVFSVGNDTSILLSSLVKHKGLMLEQVNCIGHSLGAHVCGFAGKYQKSKIGRITGLDPAGPMFRKLNSTKRLDKSDAVYVDVSHTNGCNKWDLWLDCYGIDENIGDSDFFPNGGKHQPACEKGSKLAGIGCDHEIAYRYYTESLDYDYHNTYFYSRPCKGWFAYMVGMCECGKSAQYMGMNADSSMSGVFYLETHWYQPFAMDDPECSDKRQWNILITIGYVLIAFIFLMFTLMIVVLVLRNIRYCFRSSDSTAARQPDEDEKSLVHSMEEPVSEIIVVDSSR